MKEKVMSAIAYVKSVYVKVKDWLVDTSTGECINPDDMTPPSFLEVIKDAMNQTVMGMGYNYPDARRIDNLYDSVIRGASITAGSAVFGYVASLFGYTFIGSFATAFVSAYALAFIGYVGLNLFVRSRIIALNESTFAFDDSILDSEEV
jgi:hypothetical protein